jgi:RimK family alpha-L-glutamate ligase
MKIAILSRNRKLYSTSRLVEAGKKRGHEMHVIDILKCYMDISSSHPAIWHMGEKLEGYDAVIPRIGASVTHYGLAVIRQFEMMGVYCLTESVALGRSRDKLRALQLLSRKGLGLPKTSFAYHVHNTKELIKLVGGAPLVVKLCEGTQGRGVILAETIKAAESVIEAFRELRAEFLVQEFIKEAGGSDIRCRVIGGKVVAAMQRVAPVVIVLILALIIINFQSFSQTFLVMLSLPFAFVGVVLGHLIHGLTMNIFSLIGTIALIGILINNLLVLITAFNDNLKQGYGFEDALKDAVRSRFRPILLTTLSTVAGLLPMIFMGGLASAFLKPPAIAIAYGLMFGLFISLTLTPAFLVIRNEITVKWMKLTGRTGITPETIEPAVQLNEHHKRSEL